MKKIINLAFLFSVIFSLAACGGGKNSDAGGSTSIQSAVSSSSTDSKSSSSSVESKSSANNSSSESKSSINNSSSPTTNAFHAYVIDDYVIGATVKFYDATTNALIGEATTGANGEVTFDLPPDTNATVAVTGGLIDADGDPTTTADQTPFSETIRGMALPEYSTKTLILGGATTGLMNFVGNDSIKYRNLITELNSITPIFIDEKKQNSQIRTVLSVQRSMGFMQLIEEVTDDGKINGSLNISESSVKVIADTVTRAENFSVKDPQLFACIEEAIGKQNPSLADIKDLTELVCAHRYIYSLDGIETLSNLTSLVVRDNAITSVLPLVNMDSLTYIDLASNRISSVTDLLKTKYTDEATFNIDDNCIDNFPTIHNVEFFFASKQRASCNKVVRDPVMFNPQRLTPEKFFVSYRIPTSATCTLEYTNEITIPLLCDSKIHRLEVAATKADDKEEFVRLQINGRSYGVYKIRNALSNSSSSHSSSSSSTASLTIIPEFVPIPGKNFSMSKYETTFAQYDAYAEETGIAKPSDDFSGRGNRPVINVNWNDANAYAAWLSKKTGKSYRLPTEEEWEFATRGGTTTNYFWGDDIGVNNANCNGCGSQWDGKQTAPVGSFKANSFGLFDMHGNVYEWTSSCWLENFCDTRVLRDASWDAPPSNLHSDFRTGFTFTMRSKHFGFRLVQDTTGINLNSEPTNTVTVFTSLKLWATNAWEGITNVIWSFGDGLADASSSVFNGISEVVNAIFTTAGEKTITATFKDSANTTVAQRTTSITVVAASSSSSSSSAPTARLSGITPNQIIRNLTGSFDIAGTNLPTTGISVTAPTDPAAICQAPNNMRADSFGTACTFKKVGAQTLEVRKGSALIGTMSVTVKTNVTGVTWASPSTTNSGTVKFGETVTYTVAGINLLEDATMGFAVEKCGVSNTEIGNPTNTQRTFQCFFNNEAGAVAGQMAGVVKDAPNGQVLFDGWNVAVEVPVIQVTPEFVPIPGKNFSMSKYETTFAEYDAYAEETGVEKPSDSGWGRGSRPVINVNWHDAVAYAVWLSQKTGKNYRLPTEEEWEFAARAGTTTNYSWGDEIGVNNANCYGCGSPWNYTGTAPVGSFTANGFGLFDMHGNVNEWTASCYNTAPCSHRVLRGGTWSSEPTHLYSALRGYNVSTIRNYFHGFRLVQDISSSTLTPSLTVEMSEAGLLAANASKISAAGAYDFLGVSASDLNKPAIKFRDGMVIIPIPIDLGQEVTIDFYYRHDLGQNSFQRAMVFVQTDLNKAFNFDSGPADHNPIDYPFGWVAGGFLNDGRCCGEPLKNKSNLSWTRATWVISSTTGKTHLYINKVLLYETTTQPNNIDMSPFAKGKIYVGKGHQSANPIGSFYGDISDLKVYDRALTPQQISTLD